MEAIEIYTEKEIQNGLCKLLRIKDSDIRLSILSQGNSAIDQGVHIGGAFSATIPMISLFYSGIMKRDISNPTSLGQDQFVLSKGHAVACLASIYADLGYFPEEYLKGSRSKESFLNGHPGPLLPGIPVSTGPLGHGLAVAEGLAIKGKNAPEFNVFCVTGDGELQEGIVWEAFMYAPQKKLNNLCVIIDKNEGQLDTHNQLLFSMDNLPAQIESFGWRVLEVDGTSYESVLGALKIFSEEKQNSRPTAIICNTKKGFGSFSQALNKHKVKLDDSLYAQEKSFHLLQRSRRIGEYLEFKQLITNQGRQDLLTLYKTLEEDLRISLENEGVIKSELKLKGQVPVRNKQINYDNAALPAYKDGNMIAACDVVRDCMNSFAIDERVISVDSDLSSTSGLQPGVGVIDQNRALNVGIAESNMMCVGEAFAIQGGNVWMSTFCPFFDLRVLRRIAIGYQERLESINNPEGWLSDGHGLDMTFLATASNLDTQVNGATHMGNDDILLVGKIAGMKIIDVSCPNQLVSIMKWIMEGNKGLVYLRIMRSPSAAVYPANEKYSYGKSTLAFGRKKSPVTIISSGRGVHEALDAAKKLAEKEISVAVYDMHSYDSDLICELLEENGHVIVAEQNNGYLWEKIGNTIMNRGGKSDLSKWIPINLTGRRGSASFVHSAPYKQLTSTYGLDSASLIKSVMGLM